MGGGRAQCVLCSTHLHPPFRGSLPSLLPATPVSLWNNRLLMGAGYAESPGEAEHVPPGSSTGSFWGPMMWGWMVWGRDMTVMVY